MSDLNNETKQDGVDVAKELETLNDKVSELDARLKKVDSSSRNIIKKITEENEQLKEEVKYVSAQLESVCMTLAKSLKKLDEQVEDIRKNTVAGSSVEDLAAEVASRIIIPDSNVDAEALAEKISEAGGPYGMKIDYEALGYAVAKSIYVPQAIAEQFDYDELAEKLAEKLPNGAVEQTAADIDYDRLGMAVAENVLVPSAIAEKIDYDELAEKLAAVLKNEPVKAEVPESAEPYSGAIDYERLGYQVAQNLVIPSAVAQDIDYDELAAKLAEITPTESISPDYIASKVAEQIIIPENSAPAETEIVIDADELVEKLVEGLEKSHAEWHAAAEEAPQSYSVVSDSIDTAEIADAVAKQVGTIAPEQFEIMVDDDGCDSLAKAIESKLDYDAIASAVAEKIAATLAAAGFTGDDIDTEELATSISDKLSVNAAVNEDALAEKAAAILSNYLPEFDTADIADRVIAGVVPAIPSVPVVDIDSEEIADTVTERILQNQEDSDFDIVIDDEGLTRISGLICDEISKRGEERARRTDEQITDVREDYAARIERLSGELSELRQAGNERLNRLENDSEEIKQYAQSGAAAQPVSDDELSREILNRTESVDGNVSELAKSHEERADKLESDVSELKAAYEERLDRIEGNVSELASESGARFDKVDGDIEEIKRLLLSGTVVAAAANTETAAADAEEYEEEPEELVTVSDVVGGESIAEEEEEAAENELIDEIPGDTDEDLPEGELAPEGKEGGVDFINMMKYNRSFIARIIQGTDEQKNYYGQVKTALLSYKKVNSNVAWGAERFNKGRETIARFKIRGKTLCLYLALNPNEFEKSVYHHADVSDNKSLHGTPMMVKIKSPLGVKKAIRLIDEMLRRRDGVKRTVAERDYAAMYPYETMDELIEDGLVKDVSKK